MNYFTSLSNWYIVHEVVKQRTSIRWICKTIKEMKHDNGEKYRLRIVTELKIEVICNNAGRLSNVKIYQKVYVIINRTWFCLLSPLITRKLYMCMYNWFLTGFCHWEHNVFLFTNLFYKQLKIFKKYLEWHSHHFSIFLKRSEDF